MKIGHKGFSLVEVIVSLAIMTIVGGAVSAFLIAGNNTYIRGNRDLTIQEETQLTVNQIIDLIIDVQNDIKYEELNGPEIDVAGNVVAGTNVPVKELTLCNDSNIMKLRWQGGSGDNANQIFLLENTNTWVDGTDPTIEVAEGTDGAVVKYGTIDTDSSAVTKSLLAQYVTDFTVDLSNLEKRKVKLNVTFELEGRSYVVHETIKLRNDFGKMDKSYAWITGIELTPNPVTVTQGESVAFTYKISGDKGAIDAGVTWSWKRVDGKTSDVNTYLDSNGKLSISFDEPMGGNGGVGAENAAIEVTVTSVADPSMKASAWVTVKEIEIEGIYIVPANSTLMQGDELELECFIVGKPEAVAKGVSEWTIEAQNGKTLHTETTLTPIGEKKMKAKLKVALDQAPGLNVIKISAQSAAVSTARGRAEAYVTVNEHSNIAGLYDVKLIATNLTTYQTDEKGTLGYVATIECLTNYADYKNGYPRIVWEETTLGSQAYTFVDEPTGVSTPMTKQAIWDERDSLGDRAVGTDPYTNKKIPNYVTNMYCGTQLDTNAYVQATVYLDEVNSMVVGIDITIPDMEKAVNPDSPYIYSDNFVLYRQGSINLELRGIDEDIEDNRITWEISNLDEYKDDDIVNTSSYETYGDGGDTSGKAFIHYVNRVGFGKVNNGTQYEEGAYLLNPTGTGRNPTMDAEWRVDPSKEYRLNVVACVDGKKVAETNVLVPRFDFVFPNGQRYFAVDAPSSHYKDGPTPEGDSGYIPIRVYGYNSNAEIGLSKYLKATLSAEKKMSSATGLSDTPCPRVKADTFAVMMGVGSDEPNDLLILTIWDPKLGESSRRNLVFYINHTNN